jgi:endonuclease YncB( thermonuclease family)
MTRTQEKLTREQRIQRKRIVAIVQLLIFAAAITLLIIADRTGLFGEKPNGPADHPYGASRGSVEDTPAQRAADMERYDGVEARVTYVVDGDTLDVAIPDGGRQTTRIRLWGINTPETVKPESPVEHFGPEASAQARSLAMGQTVRLELYANSTRDIHGRLLAYIILPDGRTLNQVLVEQGYAFADPRYEHPARDDYMALQQQAHAARRGLWANPNPQHFPYYLPDALRR